VTEQLVEMVQYSPHHFERLGHWPAALGNISGPVGPFTLPKLLLSIPSHAIQLDVSAHAQIEITLHIRGSILAHLGI
jgi:hypothetical protein